MELIGEPCEAGLNFGIHCYYFYDDCKLECLLV
jgi:hypothetical protein